MFSGSMLASASAIVLDTVRNVPIMILAVVFWITSIGLTIQFGMFPCLFTVAHADAAYATLNITRAWYTWRALCGLNPFSP
jgi:hypothetical protein